MSVPSIPATTVKLISEIKIPADRQREKAVADEALMTSITQHGLINAIVIKADGTLVAGERRLDAHRQLNKEFIEVKIFEEMSEQDAFLVELQENLARKQLTWQEECRAIHKLHQMKLANFAGWTQQGTASEIGMSSSWVGKLIIVAEEMAAEGPDGSISTAASHAGAYNLITTRMERATAAAQSRGLIAVDAIDQTIMSADASKEEKTAALMKKMKEPLAQASAPVSVIEQGRQAKQLLEQHKDKTPVKADERIICTDFCRWAATYTGPKFDLLHLDFPYGKDYAGSNTRKTGKDTSTPAYSDSQNVLWELCEAFVIHQDRFATDTCHMIFWFDMMYYQQLVDFFSEAGWRLVQPYPYIWTKGYTGVAADPKRRPRHCYETALIFARGDRKLIKLENDHIAANLDEKLHMSQKPIKVLTHLLSMFIDEHTAVLDPTCGSGSALNAALLLGAERVLGLEIDQSNADVAATIVNRTGK